MCEERMSGDTGGVSCFIAIHLLLILVHDTFATGNPASDKEKRKRMEELLKSELFFEAIGIFL